MSNIDYSGLNGETTAIGRTTGEGRVKRLALPLLLLGGAAAIGYMIWSDATRTSGRLTDRDNERFEPPAFQPRTFEDPPPRRGDRIVVEPKPQTPPPQTVVQQVGPDLDAQRRLLEEQRRLEEERRRAELARLSAEDERRRREEAEKLRWERLRSSLIVVDNESASSTTRANVPGETNPSALRVEAERDANRAFLNQAGQQGVETARATQVARIDALVAQGTMIRGIVETAIQSDLPGQIRAITSEDVWSFDGRRVLIPAGSRLIGEYRSGLARGQTRIFIVWQRMLRADGVSVQLGSIGTDDLGRAGVTGEVDNKYVERFGAAIMLSLIGGVSQFIAGLGQNQQVQNAPIQIVDPVTGQVTTIQSQGNQTLLNARQIGAQTVSQTLTQLAQEALRDSINIPPTVHVDQGTRIMIFVRRDLDFSALYPDPVREEAGRLARGGVPKTPRSPFLPRPDAPAFVAEPPAPVQPAKAIHKP